VFSARPPRALLTKLDPGGVYGDFLSFPVLENQASTTSGLVHNGLGASSEVSSTAFVEMGRDGAPCSVDFVRKEVPGKIADIPGFLELSGLPFGEKWCDQNLFNAFSIFGRARAWGASPRSFWRNAVPEVLWLHAATWLAAKMERPLGNPWSELQWSHALARGMLGYSLIALLVIVLPLFMPFRAPAHLVYTALVLTEWLLADCVLGVVEVMLSVLAWCVEHPRGVFWLAFMCCTAKAGAVVCMSCHDAVPGCEGGIACPYHSTPFINSEILRSASGSHDHTFGEGDDETTVTHTLLVAVTVLPRIITRFLSRGVLDFFKTVARRPAVGTVQDVEAMSDEDLIRAVRGGAVTPDDALTSLLTRLATASAGQVPRLNALVSTIGHMNRLGSSSTTVGTGANGELLGVFTFAYTQVGRMVHFSGAALAVAGEASSNEASEAKVILQAKILRPRTSSEFFHMLTLWGMVCHAMGVANSLATGAFVLKVVFDQMVGFNLSWQQAHELFLVYLEAVETAPSASGLTLANVYESGGQDMYREKALARAKEHFKMGNAPPGVKPPGERDEEGKQRIFRGQFNNSATKCCLTFNLGRDKHPQGALDKNGKCIFNHKCDHWVSEQPDGTKGGICGSTKHGRHNCDNSKRADAKVDG
jgi:hypothetical protein